MFYPESTDKKHINCNTKLYMLHIAPLCNPWSLSYKEYSLKWTGLRGEENYLWYSKWFETYHKYKQNTLEWQ